MYRIREVDGSDDEIADHLSTLHTLTFFDPKIFANPEVGHWWLAYLDQEPVAFAGVMKSPIVRNAYYFNRVGVLKAHRGHGLQRRLMRCLEAKAHRMGAQRIVSDTTDNVPSANNFIAAGYWMFDPEHPWSFSNSIYWTKQL